MKHVIKIILSCMIVSSFGVLSYGAYAGVNQNINVSNEADYTKPRTVNYYDSDGTTLLLSTKTEKGNMALKPANPIKANSGKTSYKFDKWVTAKGGTTAADLTDITTDINVYPSFDEIDNSIDVVKVAAGASHSLALTDTGEIYSWGRNDAGQAGLGATDSPKTSPTLVPKPSGVHKFTDIAAGFGHSLALTDTGTIYSWGDNGNGQLGLGDATYRIKPILVTMSGVKFTEIAAGYDYSMALTDGGLLYTWGRNTESQLGLGDNNDDQPTPQKVTMPVGVSKFIDIDAGGFHSLALTDTGDIYAWGTNLYGQLGLGDAAKNTTLTTPQKVGKPEGVNRFTKMVAGEYHTLALTDSRDLYSFGHYTEGCLGLGAITADQTSPQKVTNPSVGTKFIDIAGGYNHSLVLNDVGDIFSFGSNVYGQLGIKESGSGKKSEMPKKVEADGKKFTKISAGTNFCLAVSDSGVVYSWGHNYFGQLGLGDSGDGTDKTYPQEVTANINSGSKVVFTDVESTAFSSIGLSTQGALYTWGSNEFGQLGLGNSGTGTEKTSPSKVTMSGVKFTDIAGCGSQFLGLTDTGDIYSWGNNYNGQLGLGNTDSLITSPTKVPVSGVKFINVQTGNYHSLALTDSGDIYSWGSNYYGQLGLGTSGSGTNKDTPQKVTVNGVKFTDIAVGLYHSLALTDTGVLYSWGFNESGQLGSGNTANLPSPTKVTVGGAKFTDIATGGFHSFALTDSGEVYSWGSGFFGQLGLGTSGTDTNKASPQKITMPDGVTKFTDISGSYVHSLALTDTGVLYSWGVNDYGQLGLGTSGTDTNKTTLQRIWAIAL